jgi:hypothetical protein
VKIPTSHSPEVCATFTKSTAAPDDLLRLQCHDAIRLDTILVLFLATNNEIAMIQPIAELGAVWTDAA